MHQDLTPERRMVVGPKPFVVLCGFVCFWRDSHQLAMASSFSRFLDHTQRRTTVGRTPLDEWSARRKDLYLTTHNTLKRRMSVPPVGFETTISADERPQTYVVGLIHTASRAEPNRTDPSRLGKQTYVMKWKHSHCTPNRAEPNRTEPDQACSLADVFLDRATTGTGVLCGCRPQKINQSSSGMSKQRAL